MMTYALDQARRNWTVETLRLIHPQQARAALDGGVLFRQSDGDRLERATAASGFMVVADSTASRHMVLCRLNGGTRSPKQLLWDLRCPLRQRKSTAMPNDISSIATRKYLLPLIV
jgi:hypothetical protein